MSSYRPGDYHESTVHRLPPRPTPPELPEAPRDPTLFDIRDGDSWRPQNEFSFRNKDDAPRFPQKADVYRPRRPRDYGAQERNQRPDENNYNVRSADNHLNPQPKRENRNRRGRGYRVATAERPLLSIRQGDATEQMFGVAGDMNGTQRFLPANDMSDSEEEQMEESESDKDESGGVSLNKSGTEVALDSAIGDIVEPPAKRRATGLSKSGLESEANIPRWSNPDPYTSLPPIDELQRKKKDVVKIIRKARIVVEKQVNPQSQVAANDDFISFGFEDESPSAGDDSPSRAARRDFELSGHGAPGVPSGPRRFSHLNNLRDQGLGRAPGSQAVSMSAESMGPPPGLESLTQSALSATKIGPDQVQDPALGNRKRTHDDVIKGTAWPPRKRKKEYLSSAQGSLTEDWVPDLGTDPTPWVTYGSNCQSESAGFRLHREICDFYEFVRPQKYEQKVRETLLQRLQTFVRDRLHCEVFAFGSFAASLYLPNADMDLVVISNEYSKYGEKVACQSQKTMYKLATELRRSGVAAEGSVEVIAHAKVPLIKFVDRITSIRVDLSFENQTGLIANSTFLTWKNQFPAMPILVTVIKQFLMMRGLNEVVNGGLGGFSVTCLVTSLLQNMPRVQTEELVPEHHLGEMLIEFLDFYGNQLDIARTGIMMDPPGYFNKIEAARKMTGRTVYQAHKAGRLAIMDPNKPDNDISGGSKNIMVIFDCFAQAHEEILDAMNSPGRRSFLDWPLGGNYGTFVWQRNHLRKLFKDQWGSPEPDFVEFKDRSNGHISSQLGHNERTIVVPIIKPNNKKSKKASKTRIQRNTVALTDPQIPVDLKKQKPSRSKVRKQNKELNQKRRADALKHTYPHTKNVPDRLNKKQCAAPVHTYKHPRTIQSQAKLNQSGSLARKISRLENLPEVSEDRRKEVARNLGQMSGGMSNSDPILID